MMTKVYNLEEIPSSIPPSENNPRRFNVISDQLMLVDLDKAAVARTFKGQLLFQDEKDRTLYKPETFVEIFWDGTLCVTTMFTREVQKGLVGFLNGDDMPSKNPNWKNPKVKDDGRELPYNERKALPANDDSNKKETEKWN